MNPTAFSNMSELVTYLNTLENRIIALESEQKMMRERLASSHDERIAIRAEVEKLLPTSGLFSLSFWRRAFTVWGHYFAAQIIISIILLFLYALVVVLFMWLR